MRLHIKRLSAVVLTGIMAAGCVFPAFAEKIGDGFWCEKDGRYWFSTNKEGTECVKESWQWIMDYDGVIHNYYFDKDGWLVTGTTVDGSTVNEDGRWTEDGVVKVATPEQVQYYRHDHSLITGSGQTASGTDTQTQTAAASDQTTASASADASGEEGGPGLTASNSFSSTETPTLTAGKIKVKGKGKTVITNTRGGSSSTLSGTTARNSWAGYSIDFASVGKAPVAGTGDDVCDFYVEADESVLTVSYDKLDKYVPGNTSLDAFVNSYLNDTRTGMKGAASDADVKLGAFTFKQLTRSRSNPVATTYDHTYIRQIDGTNYAMIITVSQNGDTQDFLSALNTLAKA